MARSKSDVAKVRELSSPKLVEMTLRVSKDVIRFKLLNDGAPSMQQEFLDALRAEVARRKLKINTENL